jgi:hypothetical protein
VDIGWRGTIQDNLAHVLPEKTLFGHYLGLARVLNEQPVNCRSTPSAPTSTSTPRPATSWTPWPPGDAQQLPNGSVEGYRLLPSARSKPSA